MQTDIEEFISAIQQQNFNQAKSHFDSILDDKMNDALEQEKMNVASQIFNGGSEEVDEEDFEDDDLLEDEDDNWTEDD